VKEYWSLSIELICMHFMNFITPKKDICAWVKFDTGKDVKKLLRRWGLFL
jgi:hypothetical protein